MSEKTGQNFENHKQMVPFYHYVLYALMAGTITGSLFHLYGACMAHSGRLAAGLIFCLSVIALKSAFFMRVFALKAQDRAIRAEENFRHYLLTGKPFDSKLRMGQIIALRFAPDEEMPALAKRALAENMKPLEIKKAIKNWKGDYYRA